MSKRSVLSRIRVVPQEGVGRGREGELGIDQSTLAGLEQGRGKPSRKHREFLLAVLPVIGGGLAERTGDHALRAHDSVNGA